MASNPNQVRFDILVDISNATKELNKIASSSQNGAEAIKSLSAFLLKMSKDTKVPLEQLRKSLEGISKASGGLFSGFAGGDSAIFGGAKGYLAAAQAGQRFQVSNEGVVTSINRGNKSWDEADRKARGYGHSIDFVRTALGTLTAVGIFQFLNLIAEAFSTAIKNAREFEETLFRLSNIERTLSLEGVEISMKGLKDGIKKLKEEFTTFSKEDIAQVVGSIATVTSELGYTEDQVIALTRAVLIYNINSTEAETALQTATKVTNALITDRSQGVAGLGLQLTETVVKAKAVEMGLLKDGESLDKLTKREKDMLKFNLTIERANQLAQGLDAFFGSNTAKIQENKAAWNDMLTTLGQVILPMIPALTAFFGTINNGLNAGKVLLIEFGVRLAMVIELMRTAFTGDFANLANNLKETINNVREQLTNTFFKEVPENAPEWFKKGWGDLIKQDAETATSGVNEFGEAAKSLDTSALEKIRDIFKDTANAVQDLAIKLNQKIADINTEYRRKELDAETDYLRKIEDINRDAERDIAKAKAKHRQEDQRDEEKYQLALWELRMRFLMDLEDALHARDARQVIRLQKQYNLDKEVLRRRHELENKEREQRQADELEDIERRRQERLEDARLEYEQKLADLNLAKQREMQDLSVWYAREFADLQMAQDRKLKELLAGWAREQQITEENAAAVYAILQRYFGPGGYTDELYQYMMQSLIASTQGAIAAAASMMGQIGTHDTGGHTTSGGSSGGGSGGGGAGGGRRGRAEGGTLIATRPTTVTFGEAGLEMATFTPLTRIGKNVGKVDVNGSLAGLGGSIAIDLTLSPDLEARAVAKSMDGVADVILRINGSKV